MSCLQAIARTVNMFKELVTVFGVTGKQGGSVANYVLGDEELSQQYSVRGVTHSPSISKVRALKSICALIIEADGQAI